MSEVASEPSTQRSSETAEPVHRGHPSGEAAGGPSTQPQRYRAPVSRLWWVHRRSYVLFVLRELSSVFVAWFVVYLLLLITAVYRGSDSYRQFLDWAGNPLMVALNLIALAFVVLHAVTWFNLAPRAIVIRLQGRRLPSWTVAAAHFAAWAVTSAAVALIVLGR
jgi:succinate dehydrogenase subunit C